MNNVSTIIHILVPQRSISIVFSSYFFIRRKSLHTKFAKETSNKASQNYIPSIRLGLDRLWPFFSVLSKYPTNFRSVVTQASLKRDVRDECLNQVLSSAESDPLPSAETCAVYLEKLCRAGNLADAAKLVQQLRAKQIFLSPNTYNLLLVTAGEWKDFGLLSQEVDKAMLIFDHMKNLKCRPDLFTYNTVLAILGRAGRVDEMLHTVASMKEANMVPDIVSYNTLINNLRKVGRLDLCLVFFREMSERGIEPDLRTYTALIDSFGLSGNIEEALRLFADMKRKQVSPSVYVYGSLISNLKRVGKLDLAMSLSEEMNSCASNLVGPKDFKRKRR
ncbi:pentatricopeptide repeat-containing protein At1g11900-like isoform X4 [Macadamia integrifolia]|uniref:pentatricopeptide repeat-containing protein At1g11900-like isoform X4 n=1 Tax=Macadamia integrifolia TaxID=60698 RepID=UPI001C4E7E9B|nr:pentatricopeptide repeat-containing protein At1g11900-like isoform X4 [Macadamia integrifolia]